MWLFSKENVPSFSYNKTGDGYILPNAWTAYDCTNKKNEKLTIFVNTDLSGHRQISLQNALKRMKTLKHPDILSFVDSNENSKEISIVTEKVVPLEYYLKHKVDSVGGNFQFISSWGLMQVTRALCFLEEKCKLQHNYICLNSIFVTKAGDWRIGLLDFVTDIGASASEKGMRLPDNITQPSDSNKVDNFGLGCLIWEIFNHRLNKTDEINNPANVPNKLTKMMQKLTHQRLNLRLSLSAAQKQLMTPGGFGDNFYVKTLQFLEEIQVQDEKDRINLLKELLNHIDSLPIDVMRHKLIPAILILIGHCPSSSTNENTPAQATTQPSSSSNEVCAAVDVLIHVLEKTKEAYAIEALIRVYTRCTARVTRVSLLSRLDSVLKVVSESSHKSKIDSELFPAVSSGLHDTNPVVRETTLRACLSLAPHVSMTNLSDVLVKSVATLLIKDEQGGIRTNSAILLARLCPIILGNNNSNKLKSAACNIMMSSLLRVSRDTFQPARLASVNALDTMLPYIELTDLATKVIPCLSFLTVDSDEDVRKQTLATIRSTLNRLEKEYSQTINTSSTESQSEASSAASATAGWTNWVVGNISNKFLTSTTTTSTNKTNSAQSTPPATPALSANQNSDSKSTTNQNKETNVSTNENKDFPKSTNQYKDSPKLSNENRVTNISNQIKKDKMTPPTSRGAMHLSKNNTKKDIEQWEDDDWMNDNDSNFWSNDWTSKSTNKTKETANQKSRLTYNESKSKSNKNDNEDDDGDGWGNNDW